MDDITKGAPFMKNDDAIKHMMEVAVAIGNEYLSVVDDGVNKDTCPDRFLKEFIKATEVIINLHNTNKP